MNSNTKALEATTGLFEGQFTYGINHYLNSWFFVNYK
jgi:hypothetical protein